MGCPPGDNAQKTADVDGNEITDWHNVSFDAHFRNAAGDTVATIEMWCLDITPAGPTTNDYWAKRVVHSDGVVGWIGKCKIPGGDNDEYPVDSNNDGVWDTIIYDNVEQGKGSDGDGKKDKVRYKYNVETREHTTTHSESDPETGEILTQDPPVEHDGPYDTPDEVPGAEDYD